MKRLSNVPKESLLYPGEYTPLPQTELAVKKLKLSGKPLPKQPPVNMDEFKDHFRIVVAAPGAYREDIYITVDKNLLTIIILSPQNKKQRGRKHQIHELESGFQERLLVLPRNADTEFVSAEYKQGMLDLHIPKTKRSLLANNKHIVVY